MTDTYRCAACDETFPKAWTDEEALAEKSRDFHDIPLDDCEIVCDVCYQKMHARCASEGLERESGPLIRVSTTDPAKTEQAATLERVLNSPAVLQEIRLKALAAILNPETAP